MNLFPMSSETSEWASEQTKERSGARERTEQCNFEQANEWAVWVYEWAYEWVTQYSMHWFHKHATQSGTLQLLYLFARFLFFPIQWMHCFLSLFVSFLLRATCPFLCRADSVDLFMYTQKETLSIETLSIDYTLAKKRNGELMHKIEIFEHLYMFGSL